MEKERENVIERSTVFKGLRYAIMISLVISAVLILLTIDGKALKKAVESFSITTIFTLIFLLLMNWFFASLQLKILVKAVGGNISLKDSFIIFLSGSFISNVTPFATGGGPFQIYFLHKKGVNIGKSSMVIVVLFILRIFFFGFTSLIFLFFFNWAISPGIIPGYVFYLTFGFGLLISASIVVFSLVPGIINRFVTFLFEIERLKSFVKNNSRAKRIMVKARRELNEFHHSLEVLGEFKGRLLIAGLCTILYWSSLFLIIPLILKGLKLDPHYFETYVMQSIFYLIIPYMPTPGASGIAEIGFASLFISFIPKNLIGLVTFVWRFLTFYIILLIGGFFALREIGRSSDME